MPTQFPRACIPNSPLASPIQWQAIQSGGSLNSSDTRWLSLTKAFTMQECFIERIPNYSTVPV